MTQVLKKVLATNQSLQTITRRPVHMLASEIFYLHWFGLGVCFTSHDSPAPAVLNAFLLWTPPNTMTSCNGRGVKKLDD